MLRLHKVDNTRKRKKCTVTIVVKLSISEQVRVRRLREQLRQVDEVIPWSGASGWISY
jgi:hypothetical protein